MDQNELVTKAELTRILEPLVNQNKKAVSALRRSVYQHGYYVKTRGRYIKANVSHRQRINEILSMVKRIKKAAGLSSVQPNHKFASKGRFIRLGNTDASRLKGLLAHSHLHCARIPNGLTIPYLSRVQVAKLRRMLKNRFPGR
jgi:hypothetical protein